MDCDQIGRSNVKVPNQAKEEWDIREALFRYQTRGLDAHPCYLESNRASRPQGAESGVSSSAAAEPPIVIALPDEFMRRLAEKGNLRRSTECEVTADGVVHKETGEKGGCIFTVSDIFWITATDVQVSGSLRVVAGDEAVKTYYLTKVGGTWQIVGEHLKAIAGS